MSWFIEPRERQQNSQNLFIVFFIKPVDSSSSPHTLFSTLIACSVCASVFHDKNPVCVPWFLFYAVCLPKFSRLYVIAMPVLGEEIQS